VLSLFIAGALGNKRDDADRHLHRCVDGQKGFPEAIESVFPQTEIRLCIVHLVRHSLNFVGWKQRKEVAADLKLIYRAPTEVEAKQRLDEFGLKRDAKFPMIAKSWRSNWARVIPLFAHPPEIRKVIYTTNAIESLKMSLRKVTKARGSFPNDEAKSFHAHPWAHGSTRVDCCPSSEEPTDPYH
jgi:putative transposase